MTSSTAHTLSERYIAEVARRLPEAQRADIAAELRGTIADTVEGRIGDGGITPENAEREVLKDLGDPRVLAMKYRDKPAHLIGPEYFPSYVALLRTLVPLVPVIVGIVATVSALIADSSVSAAVGQGVGAAAQVVFHIFFWVTLVFALIERKEGRAPKGLVDDWTPDKLPDHVKATRVGLGEFIWSLIGIAMIAVFLVWQKDHSYLLNADGKSVALFHPDLWHGWIIAIYLTLAAFVVVEIAKFRTGHWTYSLAWANGIANAAFVAVVAGLTISHRLVNPAFISTIKTEINQPDVTNLVTWLAANCWVLIGIIVVIN
ncbi:HAAS signaling domain-containing protein [Smaragdicoccus niigatensis]|uniref:HAAS signaling domain-containing protein n=1 Tax=Smaragdicoccus niigatensis TaxID=359359 RepID=UPI00036867A0|nr:permease prefix domain 1-containing protein [Smaragdicoccus niigatensis]